jgi:hypothetical protein
MTVIDKVNVNKRFGAISGKIAALRVINIRTVIKHGMMY